MRKITYTDILSLTVFIPESSSWIINNVRNLLKEIFKFILISASQSVNELIGRSL